MEGLLNYNMHFLIKCFIVALDEVKVKIYTAFYITIFSHPIGHSWYSLNKIT